MKFIPAMVVSSCRACPHMEVEADFETYPSGGFYCQLTQIHLKGSTFEIDPTCPLQDYVPSNP